MSEAPPPTGSARGLTSLLGRRGGPVVILLAVALYLGVLAVGGGRERLPSLRVPASSVAFKDLLNVTTAWDCVAQGADPRDLMERNACDPAGQRPANYPRWWTLPGKAGLGSGHTDALGVGLAVLFLCSVLWLARRATIGQGLVWAAAVTSPPVVLGVERGNVDLAVFALVVAAVALLRDPPWRRGLAHALLLLAALLKLFPAFAFVVLLRQPGRWRVWGPAVVASLFGLSLVATLGDLRTFVPAIPRQVDWSFGAAVVGDALDVEHLGATTAVLVLLAAGVAVALARRDAAAWSAVAAEPGEPVNALVAGAAMFVGSFALFQSWDYRLVVLLLVLPRLLDGRTAAPLRRTTVGLVVGALWLSAEVTVRDAAFPWDELVLWALFVVLGAMLVGTLVPALRRAQAPSPGARRGAAPA